jgi:hypothetical protein
LSIGNTYWTDALEIPVVQSIISKDKVVPIEEVITIVNNCLAGYFRKKECNGGKALDEATEESLEMLKKYLIKHEDINIILDKEIDKMPNTKTDAQISTDEIEMTKAEVEAELKEAIENLDTDDDGSFETYDSDPRRMSVKTLLKKYADGELIIPDYQRRYVWNKVKQNEFYDTIKAMLPTPSIILAEWNGVTSIVDGFQRLTTLMLMTNRSDYTEAQKKLVRNYKVDTITVYNMSPTAQRKYFKLLNSGIQLASIVKERTRLTDAVSEAVLKVARNELFENDNTNATFNKGQHNEIIAENALLAVSGVELTDNKAKTLTKLLNENEEQIISNVDKANEILSFIASCYANIGTKRIERSMNNSFLSILVRVLADNESLRIKENVIRLINYIFAGAKSTKAYSETTGNGGSDASKCIKRYELIEQWLNEPPEIVITENMLKEFTIQYRDRNITDTKGEHVLDFNSLSDDARTKLLELNLNGRYNEFDKFIAGYNKG